VERFFDTKHVKIPKNRRQKKRKYPILEPLYNQKQRIFTTQENTDTMIFI
jgi:hypothetical protein